MARGVRRSIGEANIREIAERRGGSNYQDGYRAAKKRLYALSEEFEKVPESYRGYLAVGICSSMESHIKCFYAYAAERFWNYPEILKKLLGEMEVNIETLISTTAKSFGLADVVASSISVSSLESYRSLASRFFSVLLDRKHDFPWSYQELFTESDPEWKKEIGLRLDRLKNNRSKQQDGYLESSKSFTGKSNGIQSLDFTAQTIATNLMFCRKRLMAPSTASNRYARNISTKNLRSSRQLLPPIWSGVASLRLRCSLHSDRKRPWHSIVS